MDRIYVKHAHAHGRKDDDARAALERVVDAIRAKFPTYNFQSKWDDPEKTRIAFTFAKEGKSSGTGKAVLRPGEVEVEIDARYKLPFFVPVVLAEMKVREELTKGLKEAFG